MAKKERASLKKASLLIVLVGVAIFVAVYYLGIFSKSCYCLYGACCPTWSESLIFILTWTIGIVLLFIIVPVSFIKLYADKNIIWLKVLLWLLVLAGLGLIFANKIMLGATLIIIAFVMAILKVKK